MIEKLKREAEVHAEEDRKKKDLIEVKNQAENLIYLSEKALKEGGDKVKEEIKKAVEEKIQSLKNVKDKDNHEEIKRALDELSTELQKIGSSMYNKDKGDA